MDVHAVSSPIGTLTLAARGDALVQLHLPGSSDPAPTVTGAPSAVLARAASQLAEYFAGTRTSFDLPLAPEGTAFQREVWRALCDVPYGESCSYAAIARAIGKPLATRAVGMANNRNPLAIIVPCHRVVGANGSLVGFGGGLDAKRFLLALEQRHKPFELRAQ